MNSFAVIIPTYNRSTLVHRAIESALNQSLKAGQIIVVDDGSTDDTAAVCRKFGSAIQYWHQANAGVSSARNRGIRLVKQPWTAFLDSDDIWTRNHLERVSAAIDETAGKARIYFADMRLPGGRESDTLWAENKFKLEESHWLIKDGTSWVLCDHEPIAIQSSVFSTDILRKAGGFDPSFRVTEDRELFCRLGIRGALCAVNNLGCVKTADDLPTNRLGKIVHTKSTSFWEHELALNRSILAHFPNLPRVFRVTLRANQAVACWRLSRLHLGAGQFALSLAYGLKSAAIHPGFLVWIVAKGGSSGWHQRVSVPGLQA